MHIRKAEQEDASAIAKVHVDSWRTTYKQIMSSDFLNGLSYEKRTELWEENLLEKENHIIVAETSDGIIIGFATAAKRKSNTVERSGDLTSIYLFEDYQGQGIGKMLLKDLFLFFKHLDYVRVFVEVLEENKTRFFYEYYGAKLIDTVQLKIGGTVLNELIYEWENIDQVLEKL
ncbi:GNAT family N-acetyltransferase [Planococcus faecalis]|uniref:GNAT family N-acetyltransferase n=1 Tax=Planococcus faecalis TaxID=1598147 RepID=A0ABM6IT59_9BACL|nr:GNAT family N-acetyltransferase [Planococcus faecalis]AQU79470.1 GNAT family N-acetyltransferase [Planococcus faecalis]OHX51437.1 GNAT family acetyltransferase [Planococcus faecalis]